MKKVIFGTALASMALLSACSSDNELANAGTTANNAIGFHVVGNKAETRATPITPDNLQQQISMCSHIRTTMVQMVKSLWVTKRMITICTELESSMRLRLTSGFIMIQMNFATGQQLHLIFMRSIQAAQLPSLGILQIRKSK